MSSIEMRRKNPHDVNELASLCTGCIHVSKGYSKLSGEDRNTLDAVEEFLGTSSDE